MVRHAAPSRPGSVIKRLNETQLQVDRRRTGAGVRPGGSVRDAVAFIMSKPKKKKKRQGEGWRKNRRESLVRSNGTSRSETGLSDRPPPVTQRAAPRAYDITRVLHSMVRRRIKKTKTKRKTRPAAVPPPRRPAGPTQVRFGVGTRRRSSGRSARVLCERRASSPRAGRDRTGGLRGGGGLRDGVSNCHRRAARAPGGRARSRGWRWPLSPCWRHVFGSPARIRRARLQHFHLIIPRAFLLLIHAHSSFSRSSLSRSFLYVSAFLLPPAADRALLLFCPVSLTVSLPRSYRRRAIRRDNLGVIRSPEEVGSRNGVVVQREVAARWCSTVVVATLHLVGLVSGPSVEAA